MAPVADHMIRSNLSWHRQPELPHVHEDAVRRAWQIDPYVSDPESVISTITSFFVSRCHDLPIPPREGIQNLGTEQRSP